MKNENIAGVIYILTNPSFPEYVKIGYSSDINKRLVELNRTECTPFAFRVYATYAVQTELTDVQVHEMLDLINPTLKRIGEFYSMTAEEAYLMFEAMAKIHGTTNLLEKIEPNRKEPNRKQEKEEEKIANEVREIAVEKLAQFSFDLVGIKIGEEVEFFYKNLRIPCKVVDNRHIKVLEEIHTLSGFAKKMTKSKYDVQGTRYFKYKGERINELRKRLGV